MGWVRKPEGGGKWRGFQRRKNSSILAGGGNSWGQIWRLKLWNKHGKPSGNNYQAGENFKMKKRTCHIVKAYHVYSAVSAVKSDLTSFRPPPISMNFFFVENLCTFRHPQVSLLNPLILLYDRHILPWIIYDWKTSSVSASPNYRWIFYDLGGWNCGSYMGS